MKAILTIGIPASGKTTWAKEYTQKNPNTININRDDIRAHLFKDPKTGKFSWDTYKFTRAKEQKVSETQEYLIQEARENQKDIIISDTNINKKFREKLKEKLTNMGFDVQEKLFRISFEEALKRDNKRENGVGYSVIMRMLENFNEQFPEPKTKLSTLQNPENPKAYVFDIDGTLAKMHSRTPFEWDKVKEDHVHEHVKEVLLGLAKNNKIIILSGRDSVCKELTKEWLEENGIPFDELLMRTEKDSRKDYIIKKELMLEVLENYHVLAIFDDRPSVCRMWQEEGMNVFWLGNPFIEF